MQLHVRPNFYSVVLLITFKHLVLGKKKVKANTPKFKFKCQANQSRHYPMAVYVMKLQFKRFERLIMLKTVPKDVLAFWPTVTLGSVLPTSIRWVIHYISDCEDIFNTDSISGETIDIKTEASSGSEDSILSAIASPPIPCKSQIF